VVEVCVLVLPVDFLQVRGLEGFATGGEEGGDASDTPIVFPVAGDVVCLPLSSSRITVSMIVKDLKATSDEMIVNIGRTRWICSNAAWKNCRIARKG
jgi:hypothetical protein